MKITTRIFIIILVGLMTCLKANGQTVTERLILTDTHDSLFLNSSSIAFDINGNYCFEVEIEEQDYFVTNNDTIGGFKFIGSTYGNDGAINYTYSFSAPKDKPYYYKNVSGIKIYGAAVGKIEEYITSETDENIAIVTTLKDSVYYYINGELMLAKSKDPDKYYGSEDDWAAFSESGNTIYSLKPEHLNYLYVNDRLIDSSEFSYTQLAINNNGEYLFAKGYEPKEPIGKYNYMFYIHSMDTIHPYVRTVWDYELRENGAYYYSGDDNGPYYIVINDKLQKNIETVSNIVLIDKETYLYSYVENKKNKINVNGEVYSHNFDEIYFPTLDNSGNFAFYGIKDYYLYKFVNGKKLEKPLSKYGARATPLYISPKGESIHYFKTDDSLYLHRDETLIFNSISNQSNFKVEPYEEVLPFNYIRGETENGNSLFYVEYAQEGYLVFNGKFSKPIHPIKTKSYSRHNKQGEIVVGMLNDKGFFAIQKTDKNKFLIVINNETYQELEEVDYILSKNYFFDGENLTFYGVKGLSFYQFNLSL